MNVSSPLVSVVIPTHNRAYCLPEAIDSALEQTYPNVEVVVIDDGSTDGTDAMVAQRYGNDARVRYIQQKQSGTNFARNNGLRNARGEMVALLDSDDSFLPWKLEMQVACLQALPEAGMIWSDMDAVDAQGHIHARYLRRGYSNYRRFSTEKIFGASRPLSEVVPGLSTQVGTTRLYHGDIFGPMVMGNLVHTSTSVIRRERLEKVRGFNEELVRSGVDFDFHLRTCREGPVAFADVPTIRYRIGMPDAMTHPSRRVKMAGNFLRTISPVIERDRERINLPQKMIDEVLAEAESFLGEALLDNGEDREARTHLANSLRYDPWQPRTARLLALTLLPKQAQAKLRYAFRKLRGK
jgi:glycosyltransferase involved in cell wall biosynthesis